MATCIGQGVEVTPLVIPDAADLAVEINKVNLKTQPWRLPKARAERLSYFRGLRKNKLLVLDREANHALSGRPGMRTVSAIEAERQVLRDLPPLAEIALNAMVTTDAIDAYLPVALQ